MWVLGIKPGSSGRTVSALSHSAISATPTFTLTDILKLFLSAVSEMCGTITTDDVDPSGRCQPFLIVSGPGGVSLGTSANSYVVLVSVKALGLDWFKFHYRDTPSSFSMVSGLSEHSDLQLSVSLLFRCSRALTAALSLRVFGKEAQDLELQMLLRF